jgi:leucyl aminopeptidase
MPIMPTVSLAQSSSIAGGTVAVVGVLPAASPGGAVRVAAGGEAVESALGGRLARALATLGATGAHDQVQVIPTLGLAPFDIVVATGLGPIGPNGPTEEQVRRAVGAAVRSLPPNSRIQIALGDAALAGAAVEGALLGGYRFDGFKSATAAPTLRRVVVGVTDPKQRDARAAVKRAQVVSAAVTLTRDLVNTPPNVLFPASLAQRAEEVGTAAGLTVEVLDERALKRGGFGGILGVGSGSSRPPRLVRLTYRPARAKQRVALIGKGITFDSGGLNLKPGGGMATMKSDMGGAAAMLAVVVAAAQLRLPIEVVATLPLAENLPSATAYRPSDVLTMRGGRTVEVGNTDAEGRLVLVDAITRAVEDEPDYLLETSTLTGGQVVALGPRVIGAMGEPGLRDLVVEAGTAAGEALWAMPLPEHLRRGLDSPIADLTNVSADRFGSMLVGGLFIADFVPDGLAWVHLDIAGPAYNTGAPWGYTPKGGTGAVVRSVLASLERLSERG